jgi:hypothetical protein
MATEDEHAVLVHHRRVPRARARDLASLRGVVEPQIELSVKNMHIAKNSAIR